MHGRTPLKAFIDGIRKEETPTPRPTKKAARPQPYEPEPVSRLPSLYTLGMIFLNYNTP